MTNDELEKLFIYPSVCYANPQDILDHKNYYDVSEAKTNSCTVPLYTKDQVEEMLKAAHAKFMGELRIGIISVAEESRKTEGRWPACKSLKDLAAKFGIYFQVSELMYGETIRPKEFISK